MIVLKMVLRNMLRHKVRTTFTFIMVFFTALIGQLYIGASVAMEGLFSDPMFHETMLVKAQYGPPVMISLPNDYVDEVAKVPGVVAASPISEWRLDNGRGGPLNLGETISVLGVDPIPFRLIAAGDLDTLPPGAYDAFERDPTAMILARGVCNELHLDDRHDHLDLPLLPAMAQISAGYVPPPNLTVTGHSVGAIEKGVYSGNVIIAHRSRVELATNSTRNSGVILRYAPGVDPQQLSRQIEERFASTGRERVEVMKLENWTGAVKTLVTQLGDGFLFVLGLVGLTAVTIMIFNVSMTGVVLLPQIGTLRALGLRRSGAFMLLAGEGIIASVTAALLATLLIYLVTTTSGSLDLRKIEPMIAPVFTLTPDSVLKLFAFVLMLCLIGSVAPAVLSARNTIAVLRRR